MKFSTRNAAMLYRGVIFFLLVFSFQNCSNGTLFQSSGSSEKPSNLASGNGEGYGGKITKNFYHFLPDFECEGRSAAFRQISQTSEILTYIENSFFKCHSAEKELQPKDVQFSPFHESLVGFQDKIFEKKICR